MSVNSSGLGLDTNQALDGLLHQVLNHALVRIGAESGSLMLVDERERILQIKARLGAPRKARKSEPVFRIGAGSIAGVVAETGKPCNCQDVRDDTRFGQSRTELSFRSLLSVPVQYQNRIIAIINADGSEPCRFSSDDEIALMQVAEEVAQPIATKIGILDALLAVSKDLARMPREGGVERVLKKIADAAVNALGVDVVTLYQYDEEKDQFLVEGTGPTVGGILRNPAPMRTRVYSDDVPYQIVRGRKPGFFESTEGEGFLRDPVERFGADPRPRFIEREGIKSMAALLLPHSSDNAAVRGEIVGVMFANYRSSHRFNIDERTALGTFADYAAIAILNARNEERRVREAKDTVQAVSSALAHRMTQLFFASQRAVKALRLEIPVTNASAHEDLELVERQARNLFSLAERLTRRIRAGSMTQMHAVPVKNLLTDALHDVDAEIRHAGVLIEGPEVGDGEFVETDPLHLQQVVDDLLRNALESLQTRLQRSLHREPFQPRITLRVNHVSAERTEIHIEDNGVGIEDGHQPGLFLPGLSTKGTLGIGLWWCRTFVRATGGELALLRSAPNEGCTFVLTLPRAKPTGTSERPPAILIVEDDVSAAGLLARGLKRNVDCNVDQTHSFEEAKKAISSKKYDLLLVDVSLETGGGELNQKGFEVLEFVGLHQQDARIIFITGHADSVDMERVVESDVRVLSWFDKRHFDDDLFIKTVASAVGHVGKTK